MRWTVLQETRKQARIAIGIPTYNGARRVAWLLESLKKSAATAEVAVTVLDDGSPRKGEYEQLVDITRAHGVNFIRHAENQGVTRSWNDLVRYADSEISVLLNDDLVLTPGWLDHLVWFLDNNECGTVSPDLWFCTEADVPLLLQGHAVSPREQSTKRPLPGASMHLSMPPKICIAALGCAFAFRRSAFDAVGGFDERTRQTHNESWLGTAMAQQLRVPSYILPDHVWHIGSATFKENPSIHDRGDREAFIAHWGAYFEVTSPRHMRGMPPRIVKWLDANNEPREQEFHMRWWD